MANAIICNKCNQPKFKCMHRVSGREALKKHTDRAVTTYMQSPVRRHGVHGVHGNYTEKHEV